MTFPFTNWLSTFAYNYNQTYSGSMEMPLQYPHTYFVSKEGNDSNNGNTTNKPFLTINKALENCVSGDMVYVLDAGIYNESIIIPTGVLVDMRDARLYGQLVLATNAKIYMLGHRPSANGQIMVSCIGICGSVYTCFAQQNKNRQSHICRYNKPLSGY